MRFIFAFLVVASPAISYAHHSIGHTGPTFEVQGEVVRVVWANPHPRVTILTDDLTGEEELMRLEGYGLGNLTRIGVRPDAISVGDQVTVAVRETTVSARYLMQNVLLPSGEELVMTGEPRWSGEYEGLTNMPENLAVVSADIASSSAQAQGIFRVWSREEISFPWSNELPLTDAAQDAMAVFNLDTDYPLMQCEPPGMPRAMIGNAWPIEFIQKSDGDIEIRMEEFDLVRTIHMNPTEAAEGVLPGPNRGPNGTPMGDVHYEIASSPLGYSVGHWEGYTLVIETGRMNWPYHSSYGVPQSEQTETVETLELSDDESHLLYEITITDPVNFTEPVVGTVTWQWVPGQEIRPYECEPYE